MASPVSRSARAAFLALGILTLMWGYTWVLAKQALDHAGPFAFSALRSLGGALSLFAVLIVLRRSLAPPPWKQAGSIGLTQTAAFTLLSTWALVEGGPGRTSVLIFVMPFWTLLIGRFALNEPINRGQWVVAAVAVIGLLFVLEPWHLKGDVFSKMLGLLAGVVWATSTVLMRRFSIRDESAGIGALSLTAWQMAVGTIPLVAVGLVVPEQAIDWSPRFIAILIFISVTSTALGWLLWAYVIDRLPAWQASLGVLGVPVVANLSSRWILDERMTGTEWAGAALIGIALASLPLLGRIRTRD